MQEVDSICPCCKQKCPELKFFKQIDNIRVYICQDCLEHSHHLCTEDGIKIGIHYGLQHAKELMEKAINEYKQRSI